MKKSYPIIIGHRGAKALAPENTLKAFRMGCRYADMVECDVHLSKDGQLVVVHDHTLDRIANTHAWVKDMTYRQLHALNVGEGQKIISLESALTIVARNKKGVIIEIKGENLQRARKTASALTKFLRAHPKFLLLKIVVVSFWHHILPSVEKINPEVTTMVIIGIPTVADEILHIIRKSKADGADIRHNFITSHIVRKLHKNNYLVGSWVVDDRKVFKRMIACGVDWITTDYPNKFLSKR